MDCNTPGFPFLHYLPELLKIMSTELMMDHLILCHPLLLPSLFPSTRVFSSESVFPISLNNLGPSSVSCFLKSELKIGKDSYQSPTCP